MKVNRFISMALVFPVMLAGLAGCSNNSHSETEKKDEKVVVPVEVDSVTRGEIAAYFTGTATIEAEEETEVVAKVSGTVEKLMVEEGQYVKAGDILAKLDDEILSVQLVQAKANLEKIESNYRRNMDLHRQQLVSTEIFQQSKFEYDQQQAIYEMAQLNLEYTSIRTPISGVVSERRIKVGNMILPNQATFKVSGLDPLIAILHIPERQLGKLRVGLQTELNVDAIGNRPVKGNIKRISPIVDPATGTVKITVETKDPEKKLRPGMFARIKIIYDIHSNALKICKDAIISEDRESAVYVVRDSVAYRQNISIGYINTTHVEVIGGLLENDIIVTTGKSSLKDSSRVEIVKN
ncbi:MAG: efflux RND transporter periplasmic adaptor subunit [Candidatus Krumholzibacteriota bacterium]|nr:efflux RND transporter periplasmic adaptor subunit [Candidatus Krumholzibacteriota bacterium]